MTMAKVKSPSTATCLSRTTPSGLVEREYVWRHTSGTLAPLLPFLPDSLQQDANAQDGGGGGSVAARLQATQYAHTLISTPKSRAGEGGGKGVTAVCPARD